MTPPDLRFRRGRQRRLLWRRSLWLLPALMALARPAGALPSSCEGDVPAGARPGEGASLTLADGWTALLADIAVPAGKDWPAALVATAREKLRSATDLKPLASSHDRYGRCLVNVYTKDGQWLQKRLVRAGLAYVTPAYQPDDALTALLAAENEARRAGRGLWRDQPSSLQTTSAGAMARLHRFQIVEGVVRRATPWGRSAYLDFHGGDWRTDFSVLLTPPVVRRLRAEGVAVESLAGKKLRARGHLFERRGGMIQVSRRPALELEPDNRMAAR